MVGKNIKNAREARGMTQEELAERVSVTRQAVSNWECEKTQPSIDMLNQLALVFEISVEELIYGAERRSKVTMGKTVERVSEGGVTLGSVIAVVISYAKWQSIGWAILHGFLGWVYVLYYIIKY